MAILALLMLFSSTTYSLTGFVFMGKNISSKMLSVAGTPIQNVVNKPLKYDLP